MKGGFSIDMARSLALIKFDSDDTIMFACYDCTSDILYPDLITPDNLDKYFEGNIFIFNENIIYDYSKFDGITDSEPVEIYIEYGWGIIWKNCTASRSKMLVTSSCDYDENERVRGVPEWADKFLKERNMR